MGKTKIKKIDCAEINRSFSEIIYDAKMDNTIIVMVNVTSLYPEMNFKRYKKKVKHYINQGALIGKVKIKLNVRQLIRFIYIRIRMFKLNDSNQITDEYKIEVL